MLSRWAALTRHPAESFFLAGLACLLDRYEPGIPLEFDAAPSGGKGSRTVMDLSACRTFDEAAAEAARALAGAGEPAPEGLPGFRFGPESGPAEEETFRLTVRTQGLRHRFFLTFDTETFDEAALTRFAGQLDFILHKALEHPEAELFVLAAVPPEEESLILGEWNRTERPFADHLCIHGIFAERAREKPESIAIDAAGDTITYGELDRRSDAFAETLRASGVRPGIRVGLMAERSIGLFVAILGVLKAGGAYLCLDPGYPEQRLLQIWEELSAPFLIVGPGQEERLPRSIETRLFTDAAGRTLGAPAGFPSPTTPGSGIPGPEDLAYIIFTSGSTGRPKGIQLRHRGLCNLIDATNRLLELGPGDRLLQFAALSFDVSVWETFMALCSGATLVLPGPDDAFRAAGLLDLLRTRDISTALLPPSLLALLPPDGLPKLRNLISVGERLSVEVVRRWAGGRRFINGYGPAEATITVSMFRTRPGAWYPRLGPPIGGPLQNTRIYILDREGRTVQIGARGEMHIGGVQVGAGYLGVPELDAERFIKDPFAGAPGARMYRTGDMARWLPDGNLEFLGRADSQVKLRGVRIELGDVEAALRCHPAVGEAVALLQAREGARPRLCAFVCPSGKDAPAVEELRRHMSAKLPSHMVPSEFRVLREFPRSPNGKLDRGSPVFSEDAIG